MNTLSARQRRPWRRERPPIDAKAVRYFVYRLHDAAGAVLYVGRSCNVKARIRAHLSDAQSSMPEFNHKREWVYNVRRVSMVGPFTWDDACRVERAEIEAHQPRGNRMHTLAHGYLPLSQGGGRIYSPTSP